MTTPAAALATLPVVRALLDEAKRKNYSSGVLGVRARPEWSGADTFQHDSVPVRVVPCESALAIREALLERADDSWMVVLTDRPEDDLGAGLLSHLVGNRLRPPDAWAAVRDRFGATGIDPALTTAVAAREVATGLLAATPADGWPAAPGGILTRDHAFLAVARVHLSVGVLEEGADQPSEPDITPAVILRWTADPGTSTRIAELRGLAGDPLADAVLQWAAGRAGAASGVLRHLLPRGDGADAVPLGLVVGLLVVTRDEPTQEPAQLAREALIRMEPLLGGAAPQVSAARSWALEAGAALDRLLRHPSTRGFAERLLSRADYLLTSVQAAALAARSDVLLAGLTARFLDLATALRAAVRDGAPGPEDVDAGQVPAQALAAVEEAWGRVCAHRLLRDDPDLDARTPPLRAAVRLVRWLAQPSVATSFAALVARHSDVDGWVDSAVSDAAPGVADPDLGAALHAVLAAVRARRDAHDRHFAVALAAYTSSTSAEAQGFFLLGDLVADVVVPLARRCPVLFLVMDGMSVGVGTEVLGSVLAPPTSALGRISSGWAEALLPGYDRRAAAVAVLPSLTEVSRASLLTGDLRTGQQDAERRGYEALIRAHGLPAAELFHKKPIDSTRPGFAVADDVGSAIDDVTGRSLVTCVLNTIDDALDRSDPGGTDWTADTVKHLAPLLERARRAGRIVVVTADHGHVVERRQGQQRPQPEMTSGRSRGANPPAGENEVLVAGPRVLLPTGNAAVLAVNERLRYGPLKAGYHGGASPAEVVVPVAVLVPDAVAGSSDLTLAPPQEPVWWHSSTPDLPTDDHEPAVPAPLAVHAASAPAATPTLFDEPSVAEPASSPTAPGGGTAAAVVGSATYAAQKRTAGRISVTDTQVEALLRALVQAPDHRLSSSGAARALSLSPIAVRGGVLHIQRLLNVEGYAVLRVDVDGETLVLDEPLLREQFSVAGGAG